MKTKYDVFICHASEDKDLVARPLASILTKYKLSVWYDEDSILTGKSISKEILDGLKNADIGVLILSKAFLTKNWTKLELGVLVYNMHHGIGELFPIFIDISPEDISKIWPFLADIKGSNMHKFDLQENATQIYTKALSRKTIQSRKLAKRVFLYTFFMLALLVCILWYFPNITSNNNKESKQPIQSLNDFPSNEKGKLDNQNQISKPIQVTHELKTTPNITKEPVIDLSSFVNSTAINNEGIKDISVIIVDGNGDIQASISSDIANICSKKGGKGSTGLLKSSFVHKPEFQDLAEGNSEIIEQLKLNERIDYLIIGTIKFSLREGSEVEGTKICTATISMGIISTVTKNLIDSFSLEANANGATEGQAKEGALQKIYNQFYNKQLSL